MPGSRGTFGLAVAAKRSPILGYNHNVRYRGLIFHVQTEDSGLLSPHLFTHLFYSGVIISTRKLVYDAGSAEDAIKSLMQAQHKAVMKDLKRGHFDDKIDQYLAGTEGLLPRGASEAADKGEASETQPPAAHEAEPRLARPSEPIAPISNQGRERLESEGLPLGLKPTKLDVSHEIATPRTVTPVKVSPPSRVKSARPPEPLALDVPADQDGIPNSFGEATHGTTTRTELDSSDDSSPEIEIELELDDDSVVRGRHHRDTDMLALPEYDDTRRTISDGIPGAFAGAASSGRTTTGENQPLPPPAQSDRKVSLGAASLPPARPITRPPSRPAMPPPQVVARPVERVDQSAERTDAVEVYAPAPPSVEPPPGAQHERPGQYAQHSRRPIPRNTEPVTSKSGSIPAGLGRPGRTQSPSSSGSVPTPIRDPGSAGQQRARTPTPSRVGSSGRVASNSGVVMTRPAVIVGAPTKQPQQRVRKAREDEGRGFGQGLISEKSLDEVILAYLSEDADEK